ncbi:unnamed protein product, partial [Aphanomyces euteiches]
MDLEERLSYIHSANSATAKQGVVHDDGYNQVKSPAKDIEDLEGGALVEGGALNLLSREAMGLFMQYGAIG